MKKIIVCLLTLVVAFSFTATKNVKASGQPITVSVSRDTINIAVDIAGGGDAQLYAYDANAYYTSDPLKGISKRSSDQGELVGTYTCGSGRLFTRPRYDSQGEDRLYQKYYVIQNGKILAGPVYASIIENNKKIDIAQKSKKGTFVDAYSDLKFASKLNANSITFNLSLNDLIYPISADTGDSLNVPSGNVIPFISNGKKYYFNAGSISHIDSIVSYATKHKMNAVAILVAWRKGKNSAYPKALKYKDNSKYATQGMNTSTTMGEKYYVAMMEFLASRYSQGAQHGLISTYVMGNELDFTPYFYDCGNFNKYMEEVSRCLRLTNLAIKKYAADAKVVVPFTHYWAGYEKKMFKECKGYSYRPYDMLNWLNKYTNREGAFDWGISVHCFGTNWSDPNLAKSDVKYKTLSGNYKTSKQITYSNLEVLGQYLGTKSALYNGKKRSVYITEAGISSGAKMVVALVMVFLMGHAVKVSSAAMIVAAFVGAMLSMGFVLLMSRRVSSMSMLVVSGVMIGYICSAVTELVVTFAEDADIVNLHNWSRGSFSGTTWDHVLVMSVVTLVTVCVIFFLSKPLEAYQLGESYAKNMGVNIKALRVAMVILSSILSACIVAFAGPISFVGIAVPHLAKGMLKSAKPILMIPACFFGGGVFCLFCDLLARTLFAPTELSISTVTAVFGAPVVLWVMIRRNKEKNAG